jgi:hypothetical protein
MAKSRSSGKKKADPSSDDREALRLDAGGYDWGIPHREVAAANMELARRLGAGGFGGCAYGHIQGLGEPFLALTGTHLPGMKSALSLLREWVALDGPSVINIEMLVREHNYTVSISQRPQLLRWRLRGIDSVDQPMVFVTSLAKTLDTKNAFIEELLAYSRKPVAPIWIMVGAIPPALMRPDLVMHSQPVLCKLEDAIRLPGIGVYRKGEARPRDSMIMEPEDRETRSKPPAGFGDEPETPSHVAEIRERRLASSLAKTIHVLRRSAQGQALVAAVKARGCADWQVEQAICNMRLIDHLPYEPKGKTKRLALIDALRSEVVEPASAVFDPTRLDVEAVLEQVRLDSGFLLRRIDENEPLGEDLNGRVDRLGALGYG